LRISVDCENLQNPVDVCIQGPPNNIPAADALSPFDKQGIDDIKDFSSVVFLGIYCHSAWPNGLA